MTIEEYAKAKQARAMRQRYDRRVADHLCVSCGRQDERTLAGHIRCALCNEKAYSSPQVVTQDSRARQARQKREKRKALSEMGLCHECGGEDYLTQRGKPLCAACQRRRNRQMEDYRDSGRMAEARKRRRESRRAAGMCTKCGKNVPEEGHVQCTDCLVRDRIYRWRKNVRPRT